MTIQLAMAGVTIKSTHVGTKTYYVYINFITGLKHLGQFQPRRAMSRTETRLIGGQGFNQFGL